MARLHEIVLTPLPVERAFAYVANFANSSRWDPNTASSESLGDPTPRVGARYQLGVRLASRVVPMEYRIAALSPNKRVVLTGTGSGVETVDDIRFERTPDGTRVEYGADLRLHGWLRLLAPLAERAFAAVGRNARDGLQRALDEMAQADTEIAA